MRSAESLIVPLVHDILAYDALRAERLLLPYQLTLQSGRAYHFVCLRSRQNQSNVQTFRIWLKQEVAALDWDKFPSPPV